MPDSPVPPLPRLLTTAETLSVLGVGKDKLRALRNAGELTAVRSSAPRSIAYSEKQVLRLRNRLARESGLEADLTEESAEALVAQAEQLFATARVLVNARLEPADVLRSLRRDLDALEDAIRFASTP